MPPRNDYPHIMFYEPAKENHGLIMDPFYAIVAPRPIGWISTISAEGQVNLAPYSFFNAFASSPHYVAFGSGGMKDSLRNIREIGEFACNLATFDLREQMNTSSAIVPHGIDEFELANLAKAPCNLIRPPRVAASPTCLECKLFQIIELPNDDGVVNDYLVIGKVIGIHIDDQFIKESRVVTAAMKPIARLGYSEYATVDESWRMKRPS
jgi:flavin reductase (DIM6/NTAB) family NADH-FMN oxidoreductase RutF